MKKIIFLFAPSVIFLSMFSLTKTYSLFSDSAISANNTFTAAEEFPNSHLIINEVLYDISNDQQISGPGGSNRGEWVEIYNPSSSSVVLTGWTIEDNDGVSGAEPLTGTINPGGFLILTGATAAEFQSIWTVPLGTLFVEADLGKIGNGLANGGDTIVLKDVGSNVVDKMSWGTETTGFSSGCAATCPTVEAGHSLDRNPIGFDTNSASDFVDRNPPTPGS